MATLPSYVQILFDGFEQQRESALLRTEMDSGPPKQAKVKSRVMVTRQAKLLIMSKEDLALFESWYSTNINEGASWFDMVDPITGSTIQARFVDGGYKLSPLSAKMQEWQISVKIENWSA